MQYYDYHFPVVAQSCGHLMADVSSKAQVMMEVYNFRLPQDLSYFAVCLGMVAYIILVEKSDKQLR